MNKLVIAALGASLVLSMPTFADDAHHPEKNQPAKAGAPTKPAAAPAAAKPAPSMADLSERMKKMQELMARVGKTSDPAERQKLLQEHMQAMADAMKAMQGMGMGGGGGMMMGMMDHGGANQGKDTKQGCPMMDEHGMMSKRMDMMQMMMEQMMTHQQAMQGTAK